MFLEHGPNDQHHVLARFIIFFNILIEDFAKSLYKSVLLVRDPKLGTPNTYFLKFV